MQGVYASGGPYTLTATPALVQFGDQSPSLLLPRRITANIRARAVIDLSACTFASPVTVTIKLRRTSGTPADLAHSSTTVTIGVIGTSGTNEVDVPVSLPEVKLGTGPTRVSIQMWASISELPSSGQVRIKEASIVYEV